MNGSAVRRLALACSFLTRLPLPVRDAEEADVGRSVAYFPAVGLALGGLLALSAALLAHHLPGSVLAVLLVALLAAVTGALHLDGVADTFDALGAPGADPARRLEILRDSRIGAHGAVALLLLVLLKVTALHAVVAAGSVAPLLVFPAVGRAIAALAVVLFPYARASGLGVAFRRHALPRDAVAAGVGTLVASLLLAGAPSVLAALAAAALALLFVRRVASGLGGVTGDVCGAAIEIGETAFLVLYLALS